MKILVTGAGGFIGSHVVRRLADNGHLPVAHVRSTSPNLRLETLAPDVSLFAADLNDHDARLEMLDQVNPQVVIDLAWYAEPGKYLSDEEKNQASLQASLGLMQECEARQIRMVLAGTCLEAIAPENTAYARAKAERHRWADEAAARGMSLLCAHLYYLYGPGEDPRRLIPSLIRAGLKQQRISVTAGGQKLDYLHVTDVADALSRLAISNVTGSIDVGSGRPERLREIFDTVEAVTSAPGWIEIGARAYAPDEVFHAVADPRSLMGIGWRQSISLKSGIAQTLQWWREKLG